MVNNKVHLLKNSRDMVSNDEFYFKSSDQMRKMFVDLPEAIDNLTELIKK